MRKNMPMIIIAVILLALIIYFNLIFMTVALAVVLGILVFVHELGHFLLAKLMGVGVDTFSLGFGPRVLGIRYGKTDYRISAVPLGGYVKMVGEDPTADIPEKDKARSFTHKPVWRRFLIVFAGPAFNILLAFVVLFGVIKVTGDTQLLPQAGGFPEDSPALAAGMQEGDLITAINGVPVGTWEEMTEQIRNSGGGDIAIAVTRNGQKLTLAVTPTQIETKTMFGEDITVYAIGISSGPYFEHTPLGFGATAVKAAKETVWLCKLMIQIIAKLINGSVPADTLGGPILVAQMSEEYAKTGILEFLFFLALFSVNLGVLNLLPIPVMDGGHLLMYIVEGIKGRPVGENFQKVLNYIGVGLLILLMVFVFTNDIKRIIKINTYKVPAKLAEAFTANPMPALDPDLPAMGLVAPKELNKAQINYRINNISGDDITSKNKGAWQPDWYFAGAGPEDTVLFVKESENGQGFPVYAAKRGEKGWEAEKAADSLAGFNTIIGELNARAQTQPFDADGFIESILPLTSDLMFWKTYVELIQNEIR